MKNGRSAPCYVELYPLWVTDALSDWPEYAEREIEWLSVVEAAERAGDASLGELLRAVHDKGLPRSSHKLYRKVQRACKNRSAAQEANGKPDD